MRIHLTNVFVDDQDRALDFYTKVLGFTVKHDIPLGEDRWLTVTGKGEPDGTELLLEPSAHPAVGPFKHALKKDGIPAASFQVDDVDAEVTRLEKAGVTFTQSASDAGGARVAVFDDTCGNLIQIMQLVEPD